jgi:protein-S-isoprenylcysteine O-methyltransferase Ste14
MENLLRYLLPAYFLLYFGIAFVAKSVIVAKRIGKNPLVLPKDDSAYGLIGRYFKLTLLFMFVYVFVYAFFPDEYAFFLPIKRFESQTLTSIGLVLLLIALVWTVIAQSHMKDSWRIGIDTETKTELVTTGLFGYSRNPIFFGMIVSLIGLLLTTPNAFTLLFLSIGYILIQIQIRLEEEFLLKQHGKDYLAYQQKVRRFI